jgi:hypothetical protein
MMPFTDTTLRKTLLVMLRATIAGEAMNARDAVLRIAKDAGYGPHELTDALVAVVQGAPKQARSGHEEMSHRDAAAYCWDWFEAGGRLSEKEQKFVRDMMQWRKPSEKQLEWLKAIYARTTRARNGR